MRRVDVLAFGRQQQDGRRDGLRVFTVILVPETSRIRPRPGESFRHVSRFNGGIAGPTNHRRAGGKCLGIVALGTCGAGQGRGLAHAPMVWSGVVNYS